MYCPNCGKQLPDGTKFCRYCGSPVEEAAAPPPVPESAKDRSLSNAAIGQTSAAPGQSPHKKSGHKPLIFIAAAFLFLIVIAAAVLITPAAVRKIQEKRFEMKLEAGYRYLDELDYEQAVIAFQSSIKINPKNLDAYLGLSDAYLGQGKPEKAADILEQAVVIVKESYETDDEISGDGGAVIIKLASIYEENSDYSSVHELYDEGRKYLPHEDWDEAEEELAVSERDAYIKFLIETLTPEKGLAQKDGQSISSMLWETYLPYYTPYEGIVSILLDDLDGDSALELAVITSRLEITSVNSDSGSYSDKVFDLTLYKLVNGSVTEKQKLERISFLESGCWGYMAMMNYEHESTPYLCLISSGDSNQEYSYQEIRIYQMENGLYKLATGFRHDYTEGEELIELQDSGDFTVLRHINHWGTVDSDGRDTVGEAGNYGEYESTTEAVEYQNSVLKKYGADTYWQTDFINMDTFQGESNLVCGYLLRTEATSYGYDYYITVVDHSPLQSMVNNYRLNALAADRPAPAVISELKLKDTLTDPSGRAICEIDLTYPSIKPSNGMNGVDSINRFFQEDAQEIRDSMFTDTSGTDPQYLRNPNSADSSFQSALNNGYALGIAVDFYGYYGGAHGTSNLAYYNYDMLTGLQLSLTDIVTDSTVFQSFLKQEILSQIQSSGDYERTFGDYRETISNYNLNTNWLLDESGFTFAFNEYEIGPYSSGRFTYTIPYEDCMEYLNEYGKLIVKD